MAGGNLHRISGRPREDTEGIAKRRRQFEDLLRKERETAYMEAYFSAIENGASEEEANLAAIKAEAEVEKKAGVPPPPNFGDLTTTPTSFNGNERSDAYLGR